MNVLTVVTPATTRALVPHQTVQDHLELSAGDLDDGVLNGLVLQASAAIERHVGRTFASERVTEMFRARQWRLPATMLLQRWPVATLHEVTDARGNVIAANAYELVDPAEGVFRMRSTWTPIYHETEGFVQVTVEYTGGYATSAIPPEIRQATIEMVRFFLQSSRHGTIASESIGDYRVAFSQSDTAMPEHLRSMLEPYRRITL